MTLEEAIKHAEEVMVENLEKTKVRNASDTIAINCFKCAEEHRQLAEWLKELKDYKDKEVEELEKMWEKIRALPDINPDYPMDKTIHISRYEVQQIVYDRISELKGENNAE